MTFSVDEAQLVSYCETQLGVRVPAEVCALWKEIGSGYFGNRVLYVFGDEARAQPRDSFVTWNTKDFWKLVYPAPSLGGPVFFAETCFGDQLGFRWQDGDCLYVLLAIDTFEAFVVAR